MYTYNLIYDKNSKRKVLEALPEDILMLDNSKSGLANDHLERIRSYVKCRSSGYIIIDNIEKAEYIIYIMNIYIINIVNMMI